MLKSGVEPPVRSLSESVDHSSLNAANDHLTEQDASGIHPSVTSESEHPADILGPKREEYLEGLKRLANAPEQKPRQQE
jgi:hypothetical protein